MTAAISVAEKEQVRGAGCAKRLLLPSLTDLFFILVFTMVFLVGAGGWQALLQDGDTGYHIRTGEYILATHQVPAHDLFSFSRPGAAWYAWEWLADVVFALLQAWAGLKGVVLFSAALLTAVFTLVMRDALRRGANSLIALGLLFMAINASYIHLLARPHIFTLLFAPVSMLLIAADRRQRSVRIWLLVPLTAPVGQSAWRFLHPVPIAWVAGDRLGSRGLSRALPAGRADFRLPALCGALPGMRAGVSDQPLRDPAPQAYFPDPWREMAAGHGKRVQVAIVPFRAGRIPDSAVSGDGCRIPFGAKGKDHRGALAGVPGVLRAGLSAAHSDFRAAGGAHCSSGSHLLVG
jgi:hypothetical protein